MLSLTYRPWGAVLDSAGTQHGLLRYRWTGREYDAETELYFHRTRYYSPAARRFIQEDAIGYGGGSNLYAYVAGRVLEGTDPDGLAFKWKGGGPNSRFYDPGGNDMGFQFLERRFDPFPQASYLSERAAQRDADYEAWVGSGSYVTASGRRALTTPYVTASYDPDVGSIGRHASAQQGARAVLMAAGSAYKLNDWVTVHAANEIIGEFWSNKSGETMMTVITTFTARVGNALTITVLGATVNFATREWLVTGWPNVPVLSLVQWSWWGTGDSLEGGCAAFKCGGW